MWPVIKFKVIVEPRDRSRQASITIQLLIDFCQKKKPLQLTRMKVICFLVTHVNSERFYLETKCHRGLKISGFVERRN
mgnify:CR=1 FL=1